MPTLEHEKAIKQYYEEVKEKYPDLDYDKFREICRTPFEYIKKVIMGGMLPKILVKHLGKFRTFPTRVKERIKSNKVYFEKGFIEKEQYEAENLRLTNHLKDLYEDLGRNPEDSEGGETSN